MMNIDKFLEVSENYNLIPIYDEIIADTETPVSLYRTLAGKNDYSFLLESASTGKKLNVGRYSFIGIEPEKIFKYNDDQIIVENKNNNINATHKNKDFKKFLENYLDQYQVYERENLPPFSGGLVGYFGYEMISTWEELYHSQSQKDIQKSELPASVLVDSKLVLAYDHLNNTLKIINNIYLDRDLNKQEKIELFNKNKAKIKDIINKIRNNKPQYFSIDDSIFTGNIVSNTEKEKFENMVKKAKNYIKEGEVFQLVLSQKFSINTNISPFHVYRALRVTNPSPYMFYLNYPDIKLIGSSPEILVKAQGDRIITRPLAGTRPRGENSKKDQELKEDLLNDEKEKAEHIMLVDLGRNDLGKVCKYNSIEVTELMGIEYYSQVMHLVSQVEGTKKEELSNLDVLSAVFPAGTVSGAPKIRAMELIDQLEKEPRGVYAGAVGYLDFNGNIDTCITIRTFSMKNNKLSVQVGAGMVADSKPKKEYQETLNKAQALFEALEITKEEAPYGLSCG